MVGKRVHGRYVRHEEMYAIEGVSEFRRKENKTLKAENARLREALKEAQSNARQTNKRLRGRRDPGDINSIAGLGLLHIASDIEDALTPEESEASDVRD